MLSVFSGEDGKNFKEEISKNIDETEFPKTFIKKLKESLPKMAHEVSSNVISGVILQNPYAILLSYISNTFKT